MIWAFPFAAKQILKPGNRSPMGLCVPIIAERPLQLADAIQIKMILKIRANLRLVVQAVADYVLAEAGGESPEVVVGFDTL